MGKRRFVSTSDSEDEGRGKRKAEEKEVDRKKKKTKTKKKVEEEEEEDYEPEEDPEEESEEVEVKEGDENEDEEEPEEEDPEEEEPEEEEEEEEAPKPIGEVIKVSGKGKLKRNHYKAFDYDGNTFEIEDPVLLTPEDTGQKPYVAIIKEITQDKDGNMMVTGQWFYRPEEAEKKGGGTWEAHDTRELFYSFHRDEVPAESVMHKCVVHFVPLHKQLPRRSEHPGFIVQKVYDTVERKLWRLTDKDYEDGKQYEIDLLVQKTRERLGELPNIETEEALADLEYQLKNKRPFKRKIMSPIDVSREDDATARADQHLTAETPGSCRADASEYYTILANFKALTGDTVRDKWLEKLLQGIQFVCYSKDSKKVEHIEKGGSVSLDNSASANDRPDISTNGSREKGCGIIQWPDAAVSAIVALEQASHDALSCDFQKYNQKMRQLQFNLKNNALLARRLVKRELEASVIFNMSPTELKEGLTAEETATKEPEESERMQMTDARCSRCTEKKVGLTDIIQAGGRGDRYQLECIACGNTWYASRDEASTLTIDAPSVVANVGTAPWATGKFEDVEKKLLSPRETEKSADDVFKKTTAAHKPVLETQKYLIKAKPEDPPGSTTGNTSE